MHSNILAPRNNIHRSGNRERKRRIETFLKKSQFVVFVAIVQARFVKAKKSGVSVLPSSFLHSLNWASTWRFWSSSALVKLLPLYINWGGWWVHDFQSQLCWFATILVPPLNLIQLKPGGWLIGNWLNGLTGQFFDKFCEICVSSDVLCLNIVKFCTRF